MKNNIKKITKNAYDIAGLAGCQRYNHGKLEAYKWALSIIKDFDVDQECIKALSDKVSQSNLDIEKTEKEIGKLGGDIPLHKLSLEIEERADYLSMNTGDDYDCVVEFGRLQHIWGATK